MSDPLFDDEFFASNVTRDPDGNPTGPPVVGFPSVNGVQIGSYHDNNLQTYFNVSPSSITPNHVTANYSFLNCRLEYTIEAWHFMMVNNRFTFKG